MHLINYRSDGSHKKYNIDMTGQQWKFWNQKRGLNTMTNEQENEQPVTNDAPKSNPQTNMVMGVTSAGDPIAPNSAQLREGALTNVISNAISAIETTTNLVVSGVTSSIDAGADISRDSIDRINDLKNQLLEELNKAQKALL